MTRLLTILVPILLLAATACADSDTPLESNPPAPPPTPGGTGGSSLGGAGGSGIGGSRAGGGSGGVAGSGGRANPGDPVPGVPGFDVEASGVGRVRAEVRSNTPELIHITGLPSLMKATPKLGFQALPFPAVFDQKFCDSMAVFARGAVDSNNPAALRKSARDRVRGLSSQHVFFPFAPFLLSADFQTAAVAAARAVGNATASVVYRPSPLFTLKSIGISFSSNAISNIIGDLDAVRADFAAALAGGPGVLAASTGEIRVLTPAADALCDLWSGAAEVTVEFSLANVSGGASSKTALKGLNPGSSQ